MGTRSFIITANPKGDFTGSYCHWDGYPSHNGRILLEHYTTKGKVRKLIQLGDISSLDERINPLDPDAHSFNRKEEGTTVAYHRDRGEPWASVKPKRFDTVREAITYADEAWCEYVYLFWNGHWSFGTPSDAIEGKPYQPLTLENTADERQVA